MAEGSAGADAAERWTRHMRRGEFEEAWRICDELVRAGAGRARRDRPRHQQAVWDGRPLRGRRVLVRCYHGLGDTIQFARFLPLVREMAASLTVWVQSPLIPLLRTASDPGALLPLHAGEPDVEYDVDVELMEIPHVLRTTLDTVPAAVPYLHVEPAPLVRRGGLTVGVVWQAGDWDRRRSVPFPLIAPLARVPGVEVHVLQRGAALQDVPAGWGVLSGSDDPLQAARVMRALDLVVSVDSMPAHLAGALGIPTWTLLHADADWRWLEGRDDSPWYPGMRLFRQTQPGDWEGVLARVLSALRELAAGTVGTGGARPPRPSRRRGTAPGR